VTSARSSATPTSEDIDPTFDQLTRGATPDTRRPSLEHYRRHDEIDLLLPI